jgi:hypothetical protein
MGLLVASRPPRLWLALMVKADNEARALALRRRIVRIGPAALVSVSSPQRG